jgi:hypothetical protein
MDQDAVVQASVKRINDALLAGQGPRLMADMRRLQHITFDERLGAQFWKKPGLPTHDANLAMDVQPELVTQSNAGIPALFTTYIDPQIIAILVAPIMAALIAGERGVGDWTQEVAMFPTAESLGETASYGDFSNAGQARVNYNFEQRQNYLFQSFILYGERENEMYGLARINHVSELQASNALQLMEYLNIVYFYGVAGLRNYGLLNDPNLYPSLTPTYSWLTSTSATANTIYQDIVRLYIQLQGQANGTVKADSAMVLAMSPQQALTLTYITQYNTNSVAALLKQNFPNLRIETAVQYATASGQLVQLFAESLQGVKTLEACFSSKMRAHMMVNDVSSWKQKRSSGGWGTVIKRPFLVASMLG